MQTTTLGDSSAAAGAGIFGGMMGLVYLVVAVAVIVAMWRVFEKAGEPGWHAIIPIWNTIVLLKIVGRPMWWFLLFFVPLVNLIVMIMVMNDLSKSFGQGVGFTVGLVLLPFVFMLILGFGNATYQGPSGMAAAPMQPTHYPPSSGGYQPPPAPTT